jgi:hypothetical protein
MRIRLMGLPEEVTAAAEQIGTVLDVIDISAPYPCRGASRQVRLYLETRPTHPTVEQEQEDIRS